MSSPVILVSPDDLRELVRSAVREALDGQRAEERSDWLDAAGAAELLGVNPRTIMKLVKTDKLSGGRIGKLWRFRRTDVERLLTVRESGDRSRPRGA